MARFELKHDPRETTDDQLIEDLRRVSKASEDTLVRQRFYNTEGRFSVTTVIRRFGSWNNAIKMAGLEVSVERVIEDLELLNDIGKVWEELGRQPTYGEISPPRSRFHVATYERRFGSWRKALEKFVSYAEGEDIDFVGYAYPDGKAKLRTSRKIDLAQRFRVLKRDSFRCVVCGASPSVTPGVELQVDHIVPYSRGGESIEANLQTLCLNCNQGKSNRHDSKP
jgi:hypothetical protein